jgi:O-succinylbenzoic acid--CoA ligase
MDDRILTGGEAVQAPRVESVIASLEGVEAVGVVGLSDPTWGERVGALVVPARRESVTIGAIREHCRDRLADYERPKSLALAESLPRTASGTVDRDAVRDRIQEASTE